MRSRFSVDSLCGGGVGGVGGVGGWWRWWVGLVVCGQYFERPPLEQGLRVLLWPYLAVEDSATVRRVRGTPPCP